MNLPLPHLILRNDVWKQTADIPLLDLCKAAEKSIQQLDERSRLGGGS